MFAIANVLSWIVSSCSIVHLFTNWMNTNAHSTVITSMMYLGVRYIWKFKFIYYSIHSVHILQYCTHVSCASFKWYKKMFERMRINYVHEFLGLLMHAFLSLFYAWLLRKSSKIIRKYEKVTFVVDQRKCIKKHSR